MHRKVFRTWLLCGAAVALCTLPQVASAQTQDLTKVPGEKASAMSVPASKPLLEGVNLGPFAVDATVAAGELFSDNIFVTKNNKESDWISTISAGVTAALKDGGNRLNLRAGTNLGRYARHGSENYDDFYAGGDGRLRLDSVTSLFGGARYDWTHESRESPDAVNGLVPTRYRTGDYYAGVLRSFRDFVLRVGGTATTYSYDNVLSAGGVIDNTDRDRTQYEAGARLGYRLSQDLQPFIQGYWVSRNYDRSVDDFGYRRASTGYRAAIGIRGNLAANLQGEIYAGALGQSYKDSRFADVIKPDFGMRLGWVPANGTTVRGFIDRSVEETTLVGASGFLRTAIGGSLQQEIRPDLYMSGHFYYSENDYQGADRVDHVSDAGLGAKYFVLPNFYVAADYAFIHRISDSARADFYENRVWFRIGAQMAPAYSGDPASFLPFTDETAPGGFYVGLMAGNGSLISALDGPRSSSGSLTADFGANGWEGDLAGGYGTLVGRVYLGAEVDAALGSQHWFHGGSGGTRNYGVRKLGSFELAARLGYVLANRALIYGRFGGVATEFATAYTHSIHGARADGYQRGLRFGGGVEFPLGGGLSGRMEYTQTAYADYDVKAGGPSGSGPDNFANDENLTRFGIVYHIDAAPSDQPAPTVNFTFGGFYAGAQAGFGSLISQNAGARNLGKTLDAQRAGTGASGGLFGGYGLMFDQIYLGAEAEAEIGNQDWNIERNDNGRIYSVAKDYSYGASLLAGYVFDSNTLAYGRLGYANTQFRNKYHDETGVYYVKSNKTEGGLRIGGGVALPVEDNIFLRLDYTWTRYGTYTVNYVTGKDTFRNSENLFRVGLGWTF